MLVRNLPLGGPLDVAQRGPAATWDVNSHLLAGIHDHLAGANWQRGGGKGSRPQPIRRPGVDDGTKRLGSVRALDDETRAMFKAWRDGQLEVNDG